MADEFIFDLEDNEDCTEITLSVVKAVQHSDKDLNAISPEEYITALKGFIKKIESGAAGTLFNDEDITKH